MADSIPDYVTKGEFNTFKQEVFDKFAEVATKKDLELVKQDVSELKKDVSELKKDVSELKKDVTGLKQDVSGLKQEVANLNQKLDRLEKQTQANTNSIDQLIIKVADMDEKMVTRDEFDGKMNKIITILDGLVHTVDTIRVEMKAQDARYSRTNKKVTKLNQYRKVSDEKIEDHEYRIKKLENKKPK